MSNDQPTLTLDAALAALPDGEMIHTFMNPAGMLVGADWTRMQIVRALGRAKEIMVTGTMAQGMGHGIAINDHEGRMVFIATKCRTDSEP